MRIDSDLITAVDLETALRAELEDPSQWLPEPVWSAAVASDSQKVASWIQGRISGDFQPAAEQVVAASKSNNGIRPLPLWGLPEKVLYRTLVNRLAKTLTVPDREHAEYEIFVSRPLSVNNANYVVAADIAACYQYIDHEILEQELLAQTGDFPTVSAITLLLSEVIGKVYGLPQQSWPSDVLAEAYLAQIERQLLRRGLKIWRYNDDFRFACEDWPRTVAALEDLEEVCRRVGFVLNDSKTVRYRRMTYLRHLANIENSRRDVADEAGLAVDGLLDAEYSDDPELDEPDPDAALRVLHEWNRIAGTGTLIDGVTRDHYQAVLYVCRHAFAHLAAADYTDEEAVDLATEMLQYEQQLTPQIAQFLDTRAGVDETIVVDAFDTLIDGFGYLTEWQNQWMLHVFSRNTEFGNGGDLDKRIKWTQEIFRDPKNGEAVRAASAVTLAKHKKIPENDILSLYDRSTPVVRPTIIAALGFSESKGRGALAAAKENYFQNIVYEWALKNA